MSFTAVINGQGNFTASVNGSAAFNVSVPDSPTLNVGMAVIGPSGLLTADAPLIYDGVLKNLSIDLTAYATESWVDANYYSVTNPDGYITSAALAPYITAASAAATYYPLTNPAGYITSSALSGYATESWVTGQGYETAAHAASTYYPLTNPSGYITSSALSPYLLSSTAALTYQPIGDYATNTALTNGLALKLDKPAVAGLDGQILSTNGTSNVWIDNQARTLFATVRNETGAPLTKGTIVYISGAAGNKPLVSKALATGDPTSAGTFAILSADISNNNNGTAIVAGELKGIDTFGIPEGTSLWLSPTVAGTWTTTKPTAPNHAVFIGTVVRAHQNQGVIEVRIQNGYELEELHDVAVLDKANNDVLVYESSTTLWKSKTIAEVLGYTPADSAALSNYYLASNPAGYITSAALGGYATESWVQSQGYLTAPYNPFDQTLNTTNYVYFSGVNTSDTITGVAITPSGITTLEYGFGNPVRNELTNSGLTLRNSASITFPDNTVQTTAATTPDLTPYAQKASTNTFTANQIVSVTDNTNAALRVTQLGTGEAFRVEDSANPDSTPFVVTADGRVGIMSLPSTYALNIAGGGVNISAGSLSVAFGITTGATTITAGASVPLTVTSNSGNANSALIIQNNGNGASLVVNDQPSDTTPFIVNAGGNVGVKNASPAYDLDVNGTVNALTYRFSDGTTQTTAAVGATASQVASLFGAAVQSGSYVTLNPPLANQFLYYDGSYLQWGAVPNPFDQSLNKANSVEFNGVLVSDPTGTSSTAVTITNSGFYTLEYGFGYPLRTELTNSGLVLRNTGSVTFPDTTIQTTAFKTDWTGSYQFQDIACGTSGGAYTYITGSGIQFPDNTIQSTAATPATPAQVAGFFGASQSGSYATFNPPLTGQYLYYDGTYLNWGAAPNPFDQSLNTTDSPTFDTVYVSAGVSFGAIGGLTQTQLTLSNGGSLMTVSDTSITFPDSSVQYKAYPFSGAVATSIEGGLLNASAPSSTNPFATEGYVDSAVAAYAAYADPLLLTSSQKDALAASDVPSGTNAVVTTSAMQNYVATEVPIASTTSAGKVELATVAESIAGSSSSLAVTPEGLGSQFVNIQSFGGPDTYGTFTWTKPAGAKLVMVRLFGGGGGGSGGSCRNTAISRSGGGGGAGGSSSLYFIPANELGETVVVVVGQGGGGGSGSSTDGAGPTNGVNGGNSSFGSYRTIYGAAGGGATGGSGFGGTLFNLIATTASSNGASGAATNGNSAGGFTGGQFQATGGGGGAGQAAGVTTNTTGGSGGSRTNGITPSSYASNLAGGAGGNANGTPAGNGLNQDVDFASGTGGGGGFYRTGQNGGNGGNGGWPSGGGGGGGASDAGFLSGTGGRGGHGKVIVVTYF